MNNIKFTIEIEEKINNKLFKIRKNFKITKDELHGFLWHNYTLTELYKSLLVKFNKTKICNDSEYFINTKQYEYN